LGFGGGAKAYRLWGKDVPLRNYKINLEARRGKDVNRGSNGEPFSVQAKGKTRREETNSEIQRIRHETQKRPKYSRGLKKEAKGRTNSGKLNERLTIRRMSSEKDGVSVQTKKKRT